MNSNKNVLIESPVNECSCGFEMCNPELFVENIEHGLEFSFCEQCGFRRLPIAKQKKSVEVEADSPSGTSFGLIMKLLLWIRTRWIKRNISELSNTEVAVMDFGCGDGQFLRYLQESGYINLTGIELNPDRKINASFNGVNVFSCLDDVKEKKYDLIFLWHVLEHIKHPVDELNILIEKLTDNGKIVISIPNHDSLQFSIFGRYYSYLDFGRNLWYWGPSVVEELGKNYPEYTVQRLIGKNYEYEVFGWLDTFIGFLMRTENFVHKNLKKKSGGPILKGIAALFSVVLMPASLLITILIRDKRQSTISFVIEK